GCRNQLILGRGIGESGDAETRADAECRRVRPCELVLGEGLPDPLGELCAAFEIRSRQEEHELLTAPASCQVDLPDARLKQIGKRPEHFVSRRMAEAVVDRLEVVEICEDEGKRLAEALCPGNALFERRPGGGAGG